MRRSARFSVFLIIPFITLILAGCGESILSVEEETDVTVERPMIQPVDEEPFVVIDAPPSQVLVLPQIFRFSWHSGTEKAPNRVRYLFIPIVDEEGNYDPTFDILRDLNENPWRYEDRWSRWLPYAARDGRGREVVLGDDEEIRVNYSYFFAVQARGRRNHLTETYARNVNARQFVVAWRESPVMLTVTEPQFQSFTFPTHAPYDIEVLPETPLNFSWTGSAEEYGGEIAGYRYGWDITDLDDPEQWDTGFSPDNVSSPEKVFMSGIHTLHIEVLDIFGFSTRGAIKITVVPPAG